MVVVTSAGARFPHAAVTVCPNGPMLLRGEHRLIDEDGVVHTTWRPVSAVCMCGLSGTKPWCDGSHKVAMARPRGY